MFPYKLISTTHLFGNTTYKRMKQNKKQNLKTQPTPQHNAIHIAVALAKRNYIFKLKS